MRAGDDRRLVVAVRQCGAGAGNVEKEGVVVVKEVEVVKVVVLVAVASLMPMS